MRATFEVKRLTRTGRKATYIQRLTAMQVEIMQAKSAQVICVQRLVA